MDRELVDREEGRGEGEGTMDAEHRLQAALVTALEELAHREVDPAVVASTMAQLVDFTKVHFRSEELTMRLRGYPHRAAHELEHRRLSEQVDALRRRLEAGEDLRAPGVIEGLRVWLSQHVHEMDQPFARWCASRTGAR